MEYLRRQLGEHVIQTIARMIHEEIVKDVLYEYNLSVKYYDNNVNI